MIYVDTTRCTGCGECVGVCPTGAISLQDGKAHIAESLCKECEVCRQVCPQDAIMVAEVLDPALNKPVERVSPVPNNLTRVRPRSTAVTLRELALPAVGSALLWLGHELVPRLANITLNALDRRAQSSPSTTPTASRIGRGGRGKRCQRRRRGRNS